MKSTASRFGFFLVTAVLVGMAMWMLVTWSMASRFLLQIGTPLLYAGMIIVSALLAVAFRLWVREPLPLNILTLIACLVMPAVAFLCTLFFGCVTGWSYCFA